MDRFEENQQAYRRLKPDIDKRYPKGHFVAIDGGTVVADAPTFDEIDARLKLIRPGDREFFVIQAGDETPEYATIFL